MSKIHSIVRILNKSETSQAGMGFLASKQHVITCTHVVCDALGKNRNAKPTENDGPISIHFSSYMPIRKIYKAFVELCYGCFDEVPYRDFAILRLQEPMKDDAILAPIVQYRKNSIVSRKPCSYYYDNGEASYGFGLGQIIEEVAGSRIQLVQDVEGKGVVVTQGFSGTPVWVERLGGVVGIIDQANTSNNRIGFFIPISCVIDCLPPDINAIKIPDSISDDTVPKLPADYVSRNKLLSQVQRLLYDETKANQKNIVVLTGPSGSGKTSLALAIYHTHVGETCWIDCRDINNLKLSKQAFLNKTRFKSLVVLDNLSYTNKIFLEKWTSNIEGKVLITASTKEVGEMILLQNNCNTLTNLIIVGGLEPSEANSYLSASISGLKLTKLQIDFILDKTNRVVILLKIFAQILNDDVAGSIEDHFSDLLPIESRSFSRKEIITPNISNEELVIKLIEKWLYAEQTINVLPQIMLAICKIPIVGLSIPTLISLFDGELTPSVVRETVNDLVDKGFVSLIGSRIDSKNKAILIPHEIIKGNLSFKNDEIAKYRKKYLNIFDSKDLSTGFNDTAGFIDYLMVKMKKLFDDYHNSKTGFEGFFDRFNLITGKIENEIPNDVINMVDPEWIANLFQHSIPKANCAILISLGQMVKRLPCHTLLADAIWQGAENYDSWARACCIHAAVVHWKNLGKVEYGVEKIHNWLKKFLKNKRIFLTNKGNNEFHDVETDLDVAVALGGLCHLGSDDKAIEVLNGEDFKRSFPNSTAADLTVIIFLIGQRKIAEASNLINAHFPRISNNSARFLAEEYIESKQINISPSRRSDTYIFTKPLGATIARASFSVEFEKFCHKNDPNIKHVTFIG